MGIKGIYGEIGSGRRVSLARLSAEKLAQSGRPLRIAIDISIWLFQVQSSSGGANPALRTLYYRLVRFLGLNIQPLFVFDGPNRPPFKRNAPTASGGLAISKQAKRLLDLFAFPHRKAPGEAEAECATLQRRGVVDYVLSEDVDTLAFGCTATMRNWSSVNERGRGPPTHVNLFDSAAIKAGKSGLDCEGMVLVALMSGGDYIPAGVPRCGIKLACEAARAGFGHDLCQLAPDDETGFNEWRERLCHELETNESGFFRTKHKALQIPESFPDRTVLRYHAHPDVSTPEDVQILKDHLDWGGDPDIKGLRDFVEEEFEWKHLSGAKKFLRNIAPSLLSHKLYKQGISHLQSSNLEEQMEREERLVFSLHGRRNHISTDGIPEVKVSYKPGLVVGLDLENEDNEESEDSEDLSDEEDGDPNDEAQSRSRSPVKKSRLAEFDPWQPRQTWIAESIMKRGAPLLLEQWEAEMRDPRTSTAKKPRGRDATASGGMRQGALESYLRVTKPGQSHQNPSQQPHGDIIDPWELKAARNATGSGVPISVIRPAPKNKPKPAKPSKNRTRPTTEVPKDTKGLNPWSLAKQNVSPMPEAMDIEQYGPSRCKSDAAVALSPCKSTIEQSYPCRSFEGADKSCSEFAGKDRESQISSPAKSPLKEITTASTLNVHENPLACQDLVSLNGRQIPANTKRSSVIVRESLEGTWKLLDDFDGLSITSTRRYSDVEVLDMSAR